MKCLTYKTTFHLSVIGAGVLLGFSCCFMTRLVPVSPIYFSFLLAYFVLFLIQRWRSPDDTSYLLYSAHVLYGLYFLFNALINETKMHDALVLFFFSCYYIFADILLYQINGAKKLKTVITAYYTLNGIYFLAELVYRVVNAQTSDEDVPAWIKANPIYIFYQFKENTFNGDSNTTAVFLIVVFALSFFHCKKGMISPLYPVVFFVFTILTFSRAAWVAAVSFLCFYYLFYRAHILIKLLSVFAAVCLIYIVFTIFSADGSFLSKIDIFDKTGRYLGRVDLFHFIFGVGANNSNAILGRYAHNLYSLLIIEYGFAGLLLCVIVFMCVAIDSGRNAWYLFLPYLVIALSYTTFYVPFLYCAFCLMKHTGRLGGHITKGYAGGQPVCIFH